MKNPAGFLDTSTFSEDIEKLVKGKNIPVIDAVVMWCEERGVDVEFAATLIKRDGVLKGKVQQEAEDLNILKKSARLPI